MTDYWYPPRKTGILGDQSNPYTASNGDVITCSTTGGSAVQPFRRILGIGGGTYNDFALNTPSLPEHSLIFELPSNKPIYSSGLMLTSWTEGVGLADRAFGALPTRFVLSGSNDGTNWTTLYTQSQTLTIEDLVDNKYSFINDGFATPVKDYEIFTQPQDTTGVYLEDVYYRGYATTPVAYSKFKLTFDSNLPNYRIDKQYNSNNPPPYIPNTGAMRISNFAVYGTTNPPYNQPTDEKMIIDFSMALDYGTGIVEDQLIDGVNTLFALIAPPVPPASGQFGIFQVVSIPSISTAYVRVSKTGTNLSNNISQDTAFKLKINYFPSANNKDLTYTDGGLLFKNNAYDDNFYYFEIQPTFAVEGLPPFPNITTTLAPLFYEQNPFYNILNLGGADYQSGAVAHPSVNFAKTFGMITDVNNSLVADPYPRDEIYPTGLVNIVDNTSLTWGEVSGVGQQIYPLKTIQYKRTSAGQLRVFLDNTSTYDLDSVFLLDNSIYISRKNSSISNIDTTPTSQLADITELVIMDGQTGIALVKPITNFAEETRMTQQYIKYDLTISVAEILALGSVPTDPILPSGMPPELIYDKIIITGSNQPININEFELYENNLNAMTNASINYIQSTNGTYHGNLINDGSITQRKVVWGTDTLTEADLTAIVADSSVNPNTIH